MTPGQLRVCTHCQHLLAYDFTIRGTDHLAPQVITDYELADYLREGWTVTFHDHAGPNNIT